MLNNFYSQVSHKLTIMQFIAEVTMKLINYTKYKALEAYLQDILLRHPTVSALHFCFILSYNAALMYARLAEGQEVQCQDLLLSYLGHISLITSYTVFYQIKIVCIILSPCSVGCF